MKRINNNPRLSSAASSLCRKSEKTACSRATRPGIYESMFSSARLPIVFECAAGARLISSNALPSRDREGVGLDTGC
jgi:hypothetical protein